MCRRCCFGLWLFGLEDGMARWCTRGTKCLGLTTSRSNRKYSPHVFVITISILRTIYYIVWWAVSNVNWCVELKKSILYNCICVCALQCCNCNPSTIAPYVSMVKYSTKFGYKGSLICCRWSYISFLYYTVWRNISRCRYHIVAQARELNWKLGKYNKT